MSPDCLSVAGSSTGSKPAESPVMSSKAYVRMDSLAQDCQLGQLRTKQRTPMVLVLLEIVNGSKQCSKRSARFAFFFFRNIVSLCTPGVSNKTNGQTCSTAVCTQLDPYCTTISAQQEQQSHHTINTPIGIVLHRSIIPHAAADSLRPGSSGRSRHVGGSRCPSNAIPRGARAVVVVAGGGRCGEVRQQQQQQQ